ATEAYKKATSTENLKLEDAFASTGLDGKYLQKAVVELDPTTRQPTVGITFNTEGKALFAKITKENIGQVLAIFLDGQPITTPVIRSEITDGKAQISGNFTTKEAQELVRNLNYGALPVPIELLSTQSVGPTLGAKVLNAGIFSGMIAFIVIACFLIIWYRVPGVVAVVALALYTILNLVIFKLVHVTLTAAGIAAFILSIGMAVDANILIFERTKEELKRGKNLEGAVREGFHRAWTSIRDSNSSSIITAVVLYYFASSSVVKGFALVFGIGVVTSMFTAISASRTFLLALNMKDSKISRFLFSSGFFK
ncbi:MAG: protein translocase subunit SecD, partial [bacterium]